MATNLAAPSWSWEAFRDWCLDDYEKEEATHYYTESRLRRMVRAGLDLDACLADPRELKRSGRRLISNLKRTKGRAEESEDKAPKNTIRDFRKALNWISDYGKHLELEAVRAQLEAGRLGAGSQDLDDEDLEDHIRRWPHWKVPQSPPAMPKSIDAKDPLGMIRRYVHKSCTKQCARTRPLGKPHCYKTYFRRCNGEVALAGNFRRGEQKQVRKSGLMPHVGKIRLREAMKGSVSGEVDVPWTLFHPDSSLHEFLEVRADVDGRDDLFTVPAGHGSTKARVVGSAYLYRELKDMGDELGVPLNFIRTKRRALTDIDEPGTDTRVTQAKGRHVNIGNTITYLGQVTSSRQRRELAARGVPGYSADDALRAVDLAGQPIRADVVLGFGTIPATGPRCPTCDSLLAPRRPAVALTTSTRLYGAQPLDLQRTAELVDASTVRQELVVDATGPGPHPHKQPGATTQMQATTIVKKGAMQSAAKPIVFVLDEMQRSAGQVLVPAGAVDAAARELDGQAADPEVQANGPSTRATTSGESTFTRSKGVAPIGFEPMPRAPEAPILDH